MTLPNSELNLRKTDLVENKFDETGHLIGESCLNIFVFSRLLKFKKK